MRLDIVKFELNKVVVEVRYSNTYLLWDKAGIISHGLAGRLANCEMKKAEPGIIEFHADKRFAVVLKLDRAHVIDTRPSRNLDDLKIVVMELLSDIQAKLELTAFNRIGFRVFYEKEYPDGKSASDALLSTGMVKPISGKYFNIEGRVNFPEYSFRWEGKAIGARITLKAVTRTVDFEPNIDIKELEPKKIEKYLLILDIDYYTLAETLVGQLRIGDWIDQAYHAIKRDSKVVLGG